MVSEITPNKKLLAMYILYGAQKNI